MSSFIKEPNQIDPFNNDWYFGNEFEINNQCEILSGIYDTSPFLKQRQPNSINNLSFPNINLLFPKMDYSFLTVKEENNSIDYLSKPYFQNIEFENEQMISEDSIKSSVIEGEIIVQEQKKLLNSTKNSSDKNEIEAIKYRTNTTNIAFKFISNSDQSPNLSSKENNFKAHPRKYFRVDDAKKHFKKAISQYATEEINSLIKKSDLPKKLKKKIHLPHYKLFSSNPKELDNFRFLSFTLKDVFTFGKSNDNLQAKNDENISKILNYNKHPEKVDKIKDYLLLKYIDIIRLFYRSEKFTEFKNNEYTKFFNDGIEKEKNISLLEEDGLVKLFQMTKKKRKRELFSSVLI